MDLLLILLLLHLVKIGHLQYVIIVDVKVIKKDLIEGNTEPGQKLNGILFMMINVLIFILASTNPELVLL